MAEQSVYATPNAELDTPSTVGEYPGIARLQYFAYLVVINIVYFAGIGAGAVMDSVAIPLTVVSGSLIASIWLLVKRLQNTGWSGWLAVLVIVPFVNIYVGIRALAFPAGYADHGELDGPAKVIIGLFVGLFLLGIVAAIMLPMMLGVAG